MKKMENYKVKVFNNLTRSKEEFKPVAPGEVRFYSCGPTTYDFLHVGNARALVVGDLIHRTFKALGYIVTFTRNFTDVDDKIIDRARELKVDALDHSAKYVDECVKDTISLNMLEPTHTPKVSETMPEIIRMVEELIEKGYAYEKKGEVLYHVPKFETYGKLSKKDLQSLEHGIRVEVNTDKRHPSDFVLWKPAKEGEPSWDSPWGKGRPGWHIECSAMARKFMGKTIDIHHGGIDLQFPHHENEIAQSEAANGCEFSHYWCHNEFLNFGKEKMSKSLGNVITIRQFVETYGGAILRQVLASVHYRSTMDWSQEVIERGMNDLERIHMFIEGYQELKKDSSVAVNEEHLAEVLKVIPQMKEELANDFNVPGALSHFFGMIRLLNREYIGDKKIISLKLSAATDDVLSFVKLATGLVYDDPKAILEKINSARKNFSSAEGKGGKMSEEEITKLISERGEARKTKNWARADEIRKIFTEAGIDLKDSPDGTVSWKWK